MNREIIIPDELTDPSARAAYQCYMERFWNSERVRNAPVGLCGSYCQSGAEAAALNYAMSIQNPPKMTVITDVEKWLENMSAE